MADDAPPPPLPPQQQPPGRPLLSARRSVSLDGNPSGTNASARGPPIRQVVGFHVEGVAPSPADSRQGLLSHAADPSAEAGGAHVSSSPNPVLIPPTFNTAVRTRSEPEHLPTASETSAPLSPHANAAVAQQQQQDQQQRPSAVAPPSETAPAVDPAVEGLRAATAALALSPPRDPSRQPLPPAVAAAAASAAATTAAALASAGVATGAAAAAAAVAAAASATSTSASPPPPRFSAEAASAGPSSSSSLSEGVSVPLGNRRTSGGASGGGGSGSGSVGSYRASFESGGGMSSASGGGGGGSGGRRQQQQRQQNQQQQQQQPHQHRKAPSSNASFGGKQQQRQQKGQQQQQGGKSGGGGGGGAKTGGKAPGGGGGGGGAAGGRSSSRGGTSSFAANATAALAKAALEKKKNADSIFSHLPQPKKSSPEAVLAAAANARNAMGGRPLHAAILRLGLAYSDGSVSGGSARADALLAALRRLVADYAVPEGTVLSRDLGSVVNAAVAFLVECRPLSAAMGSAVKFVKLAVSTSDPGARPSEAIEALVDAIDAYRAEKVEFALAAVAERAASYVEEGDVVLTYGHSGAVLAALLEADRRLRQKRRRMLSRGGSGGGGGGDDESPSSSFHASSVGAFRVIVVDGRPDLSAKEKLLPKLLEAGIPCTYVMLSALSYILPEATKVFLGADAVLSNGVVVARAGGAAVAMAAAGSGGGGCSGGSGGSGSKPVLVCCETHKFQDRVQLDSITSNELRDPRALARVPGRRGGCVKAAEVGAAVGTSSSGGGGGKASSKGGKGAASASPDSNIDSGCGEFGELDAGDTAWASCSPNLSLLNIAVDVCPAEFITAVITELGPMPPSSVPVVLREFRGEHAPGL